MTILEFIRILVRILEFKREILEFWNLVDNFGQLRTPRSPQKEMTMGVVKIPVGVVAKREDRYSFSNFFRLFNSSGHFYITETLMENTYHVTK